jgi:hypothetical protein
METFIAIALITAIVVLGVAVWVMIDPDVFDHHRDSLGHRA